MSKTEVIEPLNAAERRELVEHEAKIEKGIKGFQEAGEALATIREKKLYREDFGTFEAYVKAKWDFTRQRAHQLIDAFKVAQSLSTRVDIQNEKAARELGKYRTKDRNRISGKIQKAGNEVTKNNVQKVADQLQAKPRNQKPEAAKSRPRGGLFASMQDGDEVSKVNVEAVTGTAGKSGKSGKSEVTPSGKMTQAGKELAAQQLSDWYQKNKDEINRYPVLNPMQMVRRIIKDLFS